MFDLQATPRIFALPPGADFGSEVINGLLERMPPDPVALTNVEIIVNTRRLERRLTECLNSGPARLHPRIRVLGDVAMEPVPDLPLPNSPLRQRLELMQLVRRLIAAEPDIAPDSAAFDLAESLSELFAEMHGEGVHANRLREIDVPETSGHWQRALKFVELVARFVEDSGPVPDADSRLREVGQRLSAKWRESPPDHPVLLVGSTGSRGATTLIMDAVARLPQGAVILPGFDTDLPENVWMSMNDPATSEDHPQYRYRQLMQRLGVGPGDIQPWTDVTPPNPARNALVSLSLRPAPVTDQWLADAPTLASQLEVACRDMTLVEAQSPREEAQAIALRLRHAVDRGQTAALVTPDRHLTRRVAAALDAWDIVPDDSAGTPLSLSPPGRFLLQILDGIGSEVSAKALLTTLKHPLCSTGDKRGVHLLNTRELELEIRSRGIPFPNRDHLNNWAKSASKVRGPWVDWVNHCLSHWEAGGEAVPLAHHLERHVALAEILAAGPEGTGSGALWDASAGRAARALIDDLRHHGEAGGVLDLSDYAILIKRLFARGEVRDRDVGHPGVLIWGTLEARVQSADLVILGSMNDGTWPELPAPDPWLNRQMRRQVGLLSPERRVGLSAHDYQQAMGAAEVWMTRSVRSDDAQTVPSRWVNRLTNLLGGLDQTRLDTVREQGNRWLRKVRQDAQPVAVLPKAGRPSPRPPVVARPRRLSVTEIETLTRDPYAVYAKRVLRLGVLHPLQREADVMLRGTLVHRVMERFGRLNLDPTAASTRNRLLEITDDVLAKECPWPTARELWRGRLTRVADWFLETEAHRRSLAVPRYFEAKAETILPESGVLLTGRADRVDLTESGEIVLYDYKTGDPPTKPTQKTFSPQLLLLSAMAEQGAFGDFPAAKVVQAAYIGLGSTPKQVDAPLSDAPPEQVWTDVVALMQSWADPNRGYTARIANKTDREDTDFDHLSRKGEWDLGDEPDPVDLS